MNSFFGLGPMELFLILFIALIVLGPQRLPGTIREVMKYWRYFRNLSGELTAQLGEEFKDLEDLSPQRILEDLAKELDDEVEQTKDAAGVKKPAAKKSAATKSATAKPAAKTPASTTAKSAESAAAGEPKSATESAGGDEAPAAPEPAVGEPKTSDATAATTASAAAAAAITKSSAKKEVAAPDDVGATGLSEEQVDEGADSELATEAVTTTQNGDLSAAEAAVQADAVAVEAAEWHEDGNTIMPPTPVGEASPIDDGVEPAAADLVSDEDLDPAEFVLADDAAQGELPSVTEDREGVSRDVVANDGDGEAPGTTKTAKPAPLSVNGTSARPEDAG